MSHFSIAINDVLDRMKAESATTRQQFAQRIGMPLSTFTGYTKETFKPDRASLEQICGGLSEQDAQRVVIAHLTDETPEAWQTRLTVHAAPSEDLSLKRMNSLPQRFQDQIQALTLEARGNDHIIAFIDEFSALLGIGGPPVPEVLGPPPEKLPRQPIPVGAVHAKDAGLSGSSTILLNKKDKPRGAIKAMAGQKKKKP